MPKQFMPELTDSERVMILQQNADKVEQQTYQKPLSEDEITSRREILSDNCIKLMDLEEEKKTTAQRFKDMIDPLKKDNAELLSEIRTGQSTVSGNLYFMANHDDGMMEIYDDHGVLISSRRLRPEEKQGNIFNMKAM